MLKIFFWRARKILFNCIFYIKKILYKWSEYAHTEKTMIYIKQNVFLKVIKQIIFNLVAFTLTIVLNNISSKVFNITHSINQNIISDILIGMVGIAGVFLGLYCSYIATVFSSKYVNAPQQISDLFKDDLINSKSIKSITNYMIFSIIAIASNLFLKNIGLVTIIVNLVMAIYMIVSYVFIGKRILGMSDIYFITGSIYRHYIREFNIMTNYAIYVNDISFQNHIKIIACKNLDLLKTINSYNIESTESRTRSIYNFMINNLALLQSYLLIKNDIPCSSIWFKTFAYKKWYNASDTEIEMALKTGTFLTSTEAFDYYWFEKEILNVNKRSLDELIKKKEFELIRKYFESIIPVLSASIKSYDIHFFAEYIPIVNNKITKLINESNMKIEEELAITEAILMQYIQCSIDIRNCIDNLNVEEVLNYSIKITNFNKFKYNKFFNNVNVEKIYRGIKVELNIEKRRITPVWYIKQLISKNIYNEIALYCQSIDLFNKYIIKLADEFFASKKYSAATLTYSKYIECYHKTISEIPRLEEILKQTKLYHKETNNFIWEDYDFDKFVSTLNATYNEIHTKWSQCAAAFTLKNWNNYDKLPDMLGACYNNICNYLIETLITNDFNSIKKVYPTLWGLVALYQELSRKEQIKINEPFNQDAVLAILSNPILDFGNISGFAYLWGEISGNKKWQQLIEDTFAKTVEDQKENKNEFCIQISSFLSIPNSLRPAIYNRSVIRTSWKMMIEKAFEASGYIHWKHERFYDVIETDCIWLKKVIGVHSGLYLMSSEAYEIFGILVLNKYLLDDHKFKTKSGWENDG